MRTLCLSRTTGKEVIDGWESISSPKKQETQCERTASSCSRRCWDWILGKISLLKGQPSIGTGCPGKVGSLKSFKELQMWCLGKWYRGGPGSARLIDGLDGLKGLFPG